MSMKNILCTMLALGLSVSAAYAAPSVNRSGSSVIVKESLTDEGLAELGQIRILDAFELELRHLDAAGDLPGLAEAFIGEGLSLIHI